MYSYGSASAVELTLWVGGGRKEGHNTVVVYEPSRMLYHSSFDFLLMLRVLCVVCERAHHRTESLLKSRDTKVLRAPTTSQARSLPPKYGPTRAFKNDSTRVIICLQTDNIIYKRWYSTK